MVESVFIRPLTETQEVIERHRTQSAEAVALQRYRMTRRNFTASWT